MTDFNSALNLRPGDEPGTLILDPRPEHQVAPDVIHFAVLTTVAEISAAGAVGAPVVPATSWREPDGSHVLRFEQPIPVVQTDHPGEDIKTNTRAFNAALEKLLLRHPEQWIWMHKRWKVNQAR